MCTQASPSADEPLTKTISSAGFRMDDFVVPSVPCCEPESRVRPARFDPDTRDDVADSENCPPGEVDYELWVEAELDSAWCLEQDSNASWRGECQTSSVRRKWDDFVALEGPRAAGIDANMARDIFGDASRDEQEDHEDDFELMVEAELEPEWCIDNGCNGDWRNRCQTSKVQRRWDEFEALGPKARGVDAVHQVEEPWSKKQECFQLLGITSESSLEEIASKFRIKARELHPDKAGSNEAFNNLTSAYNSARKAAASRQRRGGPSSSA